MRLPDVNVLVSAYRADADAHDVCAPWLQDLVNGPEAFGITDLACSGFLRIVTHPRVFRPPSPLEHALSFLELLRAQPHCRIIAPGARHWPIFIDLCTAARARGNIIADAWFAALAIESGCEWITLDGDFARFPGLRWSPPA